MHKYLRAIGFSDIKSTKEMNELIVEAVKSSCKKLYTTISNDSEILYSEYYSKFGKRLGLCIRGEYSDNNSFSCDYSFPYIDGTGITSYEDISVEQHIEKLSFAGVIEDYSIGISLIFYLQNIITYMKYLNSDRLPLSGTSLTLSALSTSGKILFPIDKDELQIEKANKYNLRKSRMIAEARKGNEAAMENLTIQDMDTYTVIRKKMKDEDIYSLVDTSFMPYGVECDLYSCIGQIVDIFEDENIITNEKVYILTLDVNGIFFDTCINSKDLMGEPKIGRRFKGVVWLQGYINFPEDN